MNIENSTILVTGVAGFIGAFLSRQLLTRFPSAKIVGLDSINDYYEVALKVQSGQTVVTWCAQNEVSIKSYYYWLRKLRLRTIERNQLPVVAPESSITFQKVEVQKPLPDRQSDVIIHLPQAILEIQNGDSQQTVAAVLLVLKALC